jgi:hypothetical protein
MASCSSRAALFASTLLLVSAEARAQTLDDVREVVETYFGTNEQTKAAQTRLREWSNGALPHLRALAAQPSVDRDGFVGPPDRA